MQQNQKLGFSFTGTGGEYFRIWIVNLFLTIITLGIYSAWAKVRRNQFFYQNTLLNQSSFDYHGSPIAILKGRILAVVMIALYQIMMKVDPKIGLIIFLLIMVAMPWLLMKSFRFRLLNTSYRGLHFGFVGTAGQAYKNFLLWPVISTFTLYLLWPVAHQRIKKYQVGNSRYGQTMFSFGATAGGFYKIYIMPLLMMLGLIAAIFMVAFSFAMKQKAGVPLDPKMLMSSIMIIYAGFIILAVMVTPYFLARLQNLVWNNTRLGEHQFESTVRARGLMWIFFTNLLGIVLTLGLFKPFADVRLARYRVENMAMQPSGDVEAFIASETQQVGAFGTEAAEFLDMDISF